MSKQESNQEKSSIVHGYASSWSLQPGSSNQNNDNRRDGGTVGLADNESYSDLASPSSPLTPVRSPDSARGRHTSMIQVIDTVLALLDDAQNMLDELDDAPLVGSSNADLFLENDDSPDEDDTSSRGKRI